MSGLDLQRHLCKLGAPVPIIFVTAHDTPEARAEAERGGCSAYFLKPVPGESIIKAITKAVHAGSGESPNHAANKPG
jgi:FixJ family two-component response regulator